MLKIKKLQVTNFRNLEPQIISFSPKINCILGENGNGKTNILEALYVLNYRKSFRKNTSFPQYLGIDGDKAEIYFNSVFENNSEVLSYSGKMDINGSSWFLNNKATKRKPGAEIVFINPFDSYSFNNLSVFRRKWFDDHIMMVDKEYKQTLAKYSSALKFRNTLLSKKPTNFLAQVKVIDKQMADYSFLLLKKRIEFVKELIPLCEEIYKTIFSEQHELKINIESRLIGMNPDNIFDYMQSRLEKDVIVGHTTYQIHKDDYTLLFDGMNSYEFCSLGQQKMSYLSLLFAYIELFRVRFHTFPIVLMDDVSGELDRVRWSRLISYLETSEFQILITTANDKFKEELEKINGAHKIYVDNGSII